MAKSKRMRKYIIGSLIVLLMAFLLTYIVVRILANKVEYIPREPYNKEGYTHVSEYAENHQFLVSNGRFNFKLDAASTKFELYDNKTGKTWYSNPENLQANSPVEFHDLYILYYEKLLEAPKNFSIRDKSVALGTYRFKEIENGLEVLYEIGRDNRKSFYDLPYQTTYEKFNELIIKPLREKARDPQSGVRRIDVTVLENAFMYVSQTDSYLLLQNKFNTQDPIDLAYNLIFNHSLYTKEDMEEDRKLFEYPDPPENPYFEFAVRYELTNEGFELRVIADSIVESEKFPIAYIDVLPYFGSNNVGDAGITVIPDGSGIVIDHVNGNFGTGTYDKRIYGRDLSIGSDTYIMPEVNDTIKMPMYGYTKNNDGFIHVVKESDTMTSIRAGNKITTSGGAYTNRVPWVHYRYHVRERDGFTFQSWSQQQRVSTWIKEYNKEDFASSYIFTDDTYAEVGYFELAKLYQKYLIEKYELEEKTFDDVMHLTILGGYIRKKHILGFPYDSVQALTTPKQILEILDKINYDGKKLDISYQGWANDGIKPYSMDRIKFNHNVTSRREIINLNKELTQDGNRLFLEFLVQSAYTDKGLKNKDKAKNIFQSDVKYYDFDIAMQIPYRNRLPLYFFTSQKQTEVYNRINKINYIDNVVLTDEASLITANFANKKIVFRKEAVQNTVNNLQNINKNVALRNSNLYGSLYADKLLDAPIIGGSSRLADYSIPFIQIVYNGYFNYVMPSANLDTSKSMDWYKLKALETGSKMQFTLSYRDTVDLIKTQYSHYYSTYYNNWIEGINLLLEEFKTLDIYNEKIVSHKTLNSRGTIVEVTYSNGAKFTINYETETFVKAA
ncbi:MAG: DUF5696 domain-containing protein [Acholeplasmataceae bacterium]|jgi:hypothetical protein